MQHGGRNMQSGEIIFHWFEEHDEYCFETMGALDIQRIGPRDINTV
jgi:hypothetical protein